MSQTLTATSQGFYNGQRVKVGESFVFHGEKAPKWAVADKAIAQATISADQRRADQGVDTRSLATQQASKAKVKKVAAANPAADQDSSIA